MPGFFPDPSITRVGDDFYIVNSSFEYFPAIPIWHSKDLVHWRQIGNAITRADQQLDLSDVNPSGGVQAATIRHHDGVFYISSTRVKKEWPGSNYHFIVTATDINGPWSKCHFITEAQGIDSALFFDDDGKTYFLANGQDPGAIDGNDAFIWMSEINLATFELVGPKIELWRGTGGIYPEGPRIYKRNGFYYLLIAEGGTLHNHTTSIARSENIAGPYKSSPRNPVLTHKHLAREYPIHNVGHADMVELKDGSWWGACLASRPQGGFYDGGNTKYTFGGYYRNLGRETFLFPITWPEDGLSPLFSPQTGRLEFSYPAPNLPVHQISDVPINFSAESMAIKWVAIKNEVRDHVTLNENKEEMTLTLQPTFEQSFIGVRQTSWNFSTQVTIDITTLNDGDCVGLAAYIKAGFLLSLQIKKHGDQVSASISDSSESPEKIQWHALDSKLVQIELVGKSQDYTFSIPADGISRTLDGRGISCDMTDSHTGVMIALLGASEHKSQVIFSDFSIDFV